MSKGKKTKEDGNAKGKKTKEKIRPERFGDDSLDFVAVYDKNGKKIM